MKEIDFQNNFVENILLNAPPPSLVLLDFIIPIINCDRQEVINIYRNDYKFRLLDALKANFEAVWMVLGDERFESLGLDYINKYPSTSYDLNLYGQEFPGLLKNQHELMEEIPFIEDLANFEIAFWKVFHSKNPPEIGIDHFTQEKILNSYFEFNDSTALLRYDYNVFPLFKYKDKSLDEFLNDFEQEIVLTPKAYLLYKKDHKIICYNLSPSQFYFFKLLDQNHTLLETINLIDQITTAETQDIFKLISQSLLNNLKEKK